MKQHIEIITKVKTIKEIPTKSGKFMYNFSIPVSKMVGEEQVTEWMQVTILQEQQRKDLHDAKEIHFIGQLTLREAYRDYPQSVGIFGFYIEPVLNQVYRQRKTKKNTSEDAPQAREEVSTVPTGSANSSTAYQDDFPIADSQVPF